MPNLLDLDQVMTALEAAKRLRVSRSHIYRLAAQEHWRSVELGERHYYLREDVLRHTPKPVGHPRKEAVK